MVPPGPRWGSKFTPLLFLIWLATGWVAWAAPLSGVAGPYSLVVHLSPSPLAVGDAQVAIVVEKDGKPATDATVVVEAEMDDLCGVPTRATLKAGAKGRYVGPVALSLGGKWLLRVKVSGADGSGDTVFPLQVGPEEASAGRAITVTTSTPPHTGSNLLRIAVRDGAGQPLDNVDVWTGLAMPGMFMHVAPRKATQTGPGQYERQVDLAMAGRWVVTVDVEATDRSAPDKNGRMVPVRLFHHRSALAVVASERAATHLTMLLGGGLLISLGLVLGISFYRRRLDAATLIGCFLCATTALAVGEGLRSQWPRETSGGMKMDMTADHMGKAADLTAPVPVVVEKARRNLFTDVLTVGAKVSPLEEIPVTAESSGRLGAWRVSVGSVVRKGQVVAVLVTEAGYPAATIKAPIDGLLSRQRLNVGDAVQTGKLLFDLARVDSVRVQARVPLAQRERLKVGTPVEMVVLQVNPGDSPKPISAHLDEVGDLVDEASQTVAVEARVANPGFHLRPGQQLTMNLQVANKPGVVTVPVRALVLDRGHPAVWLVGDLAGQLVARLHFVEVGLASQEDVEITSGLQDGDDYIDDGVSLLEEGTTVNPASRGGGPYRNLLLPTETTPLSP